MYLNRETITLINAVRARATERGHVAAQTNSRQNGHFCDAVRIYANEADKGAPTRAIATMTTAAELRAYLAEAPR